MAAAPKTCLVPVSSVAQPESALSPAGSSRSGQAARSGKRGWFLGWLVLAGLVGGLDQFTKAWVVELFREGERLPVTGFFNLVLLYNPGASFSFLAGAGGWQRWLFAVLAVVISIWLVIMLYRQALDKPQSVAVALILGGAVGNVIDRIRIGAVVDFLDFYVADWHWPAFNVADSAICVGVAFMLWLQWANRKESA